MRQPRKDFLRSRQAIMEAAEEILVKDGEASFTEIAVLAGVGHATVYRHFSDRSELLSALMSRELDRLEAKVASWDLGPDTFEQLLRLMAREQAKYQGVVASVRRGEVDESRVEDLRGRTSKLFRVPLLEAKSAGRVSEKLEVTGIIGLLSMIDGAIAPHPTRLAREEAASKAVDIVLNGLRP